MSELHFDYTTGERKDGVFKITGYTKEGDMEVSNSEEFTLSEAFKLLKKYEIK